MGFYSRIGYPGHCTFCKFYITSNMLSLFKNTTRLVRYLNTFFTTFFKKFSKCSSVQTKYFSKLFSEALLCYIAFLFCINIFKKRLFYREGVGTSKIRTSNGQNIESIFRMIRTSKVKRPEHQKSECWKEHQK